MKHNIGGKQAEKLAIKHFGPKAYALRTSKAFEVGRFWGTFRIVKGTGKSWYAALRDAGIEIPNTVNGANVATPGDVDELISKSMEGEGGEA